MMEEMFRKGSSVMVESSSGSGGGRVKGWLGSLVELEGTARDGEGLLLSAFS